MSLRTPTGWQDSPIGTTTQQDEVPDAEEQGEVDTDEEDHTYEEALFDEATPFIPQNSSSDNVTLSDQAAIEHEANQWALLWRKKTEYVEPHFEINDHMLRQLFPEAIKEAAKTSPADTGLGHDHVSPRALLRLSDQALWALAKLFMAFKRG